MPHLRPHRPDARVCYAASSGVRSGHSSSALSMARMESVRCSSEPGSHHGWRDHGSWQASLMTPGDHRVGTDDLVEAAVRQALQLGGQAVALHGLQPPCPVLPGRAQCHMASAEHTAPWGHAARGMPWRLLACQQGLRAAERTTTANRPQALGGAPVIDDQCMRRRRSPARRRRTAGAALGGRSWRRSL